MRRLCPLLCAAALGALALAACTADSPDKAAKKRIFSPEDPPKVVASAKERIPSDGLEDAALARRVLRMGAAEATERLGPHRYRATVKMEWSTPGRAGELALTEERTLLAGPGGTAGDFHARVQNSREQGLEVIRAQGAVYARSRYGKHRERRRDRGMAEREREEVFGALRDFDTLFHGRLKLQDAGAEPHDGRSAHRYQVTLGPPAEDPDAPALPPIIEPKGGVDPFTSARRQFAQKREPQELAGWVWVDEETSAVLRASLEGKIKVPAGEERREAVVRLSLESAVTGVGVDPQVRPPKDFLPDEDKPQGIADALDRFGVPRGAAAADGGTAAGALKPASSFAAPDEPEDDAP